MQKLIQQTQSIHFPEKSYIICSTPRSGTNLIRTGLHNLGYGYPLEAFPLSNNKKYGWGHDQSDILHYCRDVIEY